MRGLSGKSARLKSKFVGEEDMEELITEAVEAKAKEEAENPQPVAEEATPEEATSEESKA